MTADCGVTAPPNCSRWNSYNSQVGLKDGNGGQGEAVALGSAAFVAANLKQHGYELPEMPIHSKMCKFLKLASVFCAHPPV